MDFSPLWISLITAITATFITFFLGLGAAHFMYTYHGRMKVWIDGILILPMVLPPTVIGFVLLVLLGKNGPVGQLLWKLGITIIFSWPAAVIASTIVAFPMMYKTSLAALEQIDKDILDAARTLGSSEWRIFWKIAVPLSWPGIVAGTILSFARAIGEFGATLMIAGNIPGKTQTIPMAIYFAVEGGEIKRGLIWVAMIIAIALMAVLGLRVWSKNRLSVFYCMGDK